MKNIPVVWKGDQENFDQVADANKRDTSQGRTGNTIICFKRFFCPRTPSSTYFVPNYRLSGGNKIVQQRPSSPMMGRLRRSNSPICRRRLDITFLTWKVIVFVLCLRCILLSSNTPIIYFQGEPINSNFIDHCLAFPVLSHLEIHSYNLWIRSFRRQWQGVHRCQIPQVDKVHWIRQPPFNSIKFICQFSNLCCIIICW